MTTRTYLNTPSASAGEVPVARACDVAVPEGRLDKRLLQAGSAVAFVPELDTRVAEARRRARRHARCG